MKVLILFFLLNTSVFSATRPECFKLKDVGDLTYEITKYLCTDTEVVIPKRINGKKITSVGAAAFIHSPFDSSDELTKVTLPKYLTKIGNSAFMGNSIRSIIIPSRVISIGSMAFFANRLSSIKLNEGLIEIKMMAFSKNSLRYVELPDTATKVAPHAFDKDTQVEY